MSAVDARVAAVRGGSVREAARLMRELDDGDAAAEAALDALYPHTGRARIVGITGVPGAGKSTLTNQLIAGYRARGLRVGVVAIDPTSPFSGGAILGDRVRMQHHATDPGVFIRSLATRGHLGGLSRSTNAVVHVLDAMGYDVILVETVGVGQDEVDIVKVAHTAIVVVVPGLGDDVQMLKAGIMEIADVFCVNKADRPDAHRLVAQLKATLALTGGAGWVPPVLKTVATENQGIDAVLEAIDRHQEAADADGTLARRERERVLMEVEAIVWSDVQRHVRARLGQAEAQKGVASVLARQTSPRALADRVRPDGLSGGD